jgi:uncharacterized membrane protein
LECSGLRIKTSHLLLVLDLLTLILILTVTLLPGNVINIILGLPFVLFFPGYCLLSALLTRKDILKSLERIALSFGLSLAIVPLICLLLNYLPWGLSVNSILYSLSIFTLITSGIALFRQRGLSETEKTEVTLNFTGWGKKTAFEKILSVILVLVVIGLVGVLVYVIAVPRTSEQYTEFYVLNEEGKASDYPSGLKIGETGSVIIGIINHEREDANYVVEIRIDNESVDMLDPIILTNDEKRETLVTFTPQKTGDRQKVEFLLFKGESTEPYNRLHLWVDVN